MVRKPVTPNSISINKFAWDLLKDSGVTGHYSTSLQHKNMQSNKHVLIHTSKFKNICSLSFFYYVDDKVYLSRYSQWIYVTVLTGVKYEEGGGGGEKKAVHFPNSWPPPPAVWPEFMANRGMLQLGLSAIDPCFCGAQNVWDDVTTLTRRHFKGFPKFCR